MVNAVQLRCCKLHWYSSRRALAPDHLRGLGFERRPLMATSVSPITILAAKGPKVGHLPQAQVMWLLSGYYPKEARHAQVLVTLIHTAAVLAASLGLAAPDASAAPASLPRITVRTMLDLGVVGAARL